jgi:hypothetical protein
MTVATWTSTPARREPLQGVPRETRSAGRPDRVEADDRLEELHHRRLHARRDREDDEDLAGS